MSKYIRTEDNIYEIDFSRNETDVCYFTTKGWIYKADVIEESNDLEDLVDGYVIEYENNRYSYFDILSDAKQVYAWEKRNYAHNLYGIIGTDKGLKYVIWLNRDNELELI